MLTITRVVTAMIAGIALFGYAISCVNPRLHNPGPSTNEPPGFGYNFLNWALKDHRKRPIQPDLIILSLSGGGIRAAAFAASTINVLKSVEIHNKPLTNNIILVSSTSGGSLAASFIATHGFDSYELFRTRFLERNNTRDLLINAINPKVFYDRSGLMVDFLSKTLDFEGKTLGDVINYDGPYFIFNSTNISSGEQFSFTQRFFSKLCSDASLVELASVVTASSAFPFLLTDVEIERKPNCYNHPTAPKYIHLMDGGLVDNLGARAFANDIDIDELGSLNDAIPGDPHLGNHIRQVLVVEIDARTETSRSRLDTNRGSPGIISTAEIITSAPIDESSSLSSTFSRYAWHVLMRYPYLSSTKILYTSLNFKEIPTASVRNLVNSIGMGLTLRPKELVALEDASRIVVDHDACIARFVAVARGLWDDAAQKAMNGSGRGCYALDEYGSD